MFPFLDSDVVIENLGTEFPVYLAAAEDVIVKETALKREKRKLGGGKIIRKICPIGQQ